MGLDMWAFKVKPNEEVELTDKNEICYWRKNNALHGWVSDQYPDSENNCENLLLTKQMLLQLQKDVEVGLKPTEGFFFGGQVYLPEEQAKDRAFVKEALELIEEGYNIYYHAWW